MTHVPPRSTDTLHTITRIYRNVFAACNPLTLCIKLSTLRLAISNAFQRLARMTLTTGIQLHVLAFATLKNVRKTTSGILKCAHANAFHHLPFANAVMNGILIAVHASYALIKVSATLGRNSTTLSLANVIACQLAAMKVKNGINSRAHAVPMYVTL